MITKTIHYCWFGGGAKSKIFELCLQSWKKHLPDFEIVEWNEANFNIDCSFAQAAYDAKRFAFVADYARFKILWEHGGIYLDTDMLFVRPIDNEMMEQPFFIGAESPTVVSAGIIGSTKNNIIIQHFIQLYQSIIFDNHPKTIPQHLTIFFNKKNLYSFNKKIAKKDFTIYPLEYFYAFPFPPPKGKSYHDFIHTDSVAVHLWEGSWLSAWNYFNIGDCKKGIAKLREEETSFVVLKIWYWSFYCRVKNGLRPIYSSLLKR